MNQSKRSEEYMAVLRQDAVERHVGHIVAIVAGSPSKIATFGGTLYPDAKKVLIARGYEIAEDYPPAPGSPRFAVRKTAVEKQPSPSANPFPRHTTFKLGDPVRKIPRENGASWRGHVVGFYSTEINPEGYAVESWFEPGSVQIYPVSALQRDPNGDPR